MFFIWRERFGLYANHKGIADERREMRRHHLPRPPPPPWYGGYGEMNGGVPPLDIQRKIMARVETGRAEIAREREAAERIKKDISAKIELMILGKK